MSTWGSTPPWRNVNGPGRRTLRRAVMGRSFYRRKAAPGCGRQPVTDEASTPGYARRLPALGVDLEVPQIPLESVVEASKQARGRSAHLPPRDDHQGDGDLGLAVRHLREHDLA